jgi:hypothetical protein
VKINAKRIANQVSTLALNIHAVPVNILALSVNLVHKNAQNVTHHTRSLTLIHQLLLVKALVLLALTLTKLKESANHVFHLVTTANHLLNASLVIEVLIIWLLITSKV